jgi:hypothetical protein
MNDIAFFFTDYTFMGGGYCSRFIVNKKKLDYNIMNKTMSRGHFSSCMFLFFKTIITIYECLFCVIVGKKVTNKFLFQRIEEEKKVDIFIKNQACPGDNQNHRYGTYNSQIIWELATGFSSFS